MTDIPAKIRKGEGFPENEAPYNKSTLTDLKTFCKLKKQKDKEVAQPENAQLEETDTVVDDCGCG